ncbi:type II toxin-antitoxin system RelE/ParE family toxin [Mesonia sediminis]|uniref:Toxin n=1 Tax=Mesonia sediminis TaxID=1703946 RepID=A0ABW5SH67_9FLAO
MSKNKYRISQQAIEDLDKIWIYTLNKWSKEQADRYYDLIIREIEFIAVNFMTGKSAEQTRKNYRVTKIKSHLIFYRKIDNGIVEIVRILHQRMDIKKRLK